MIKFIQRYFKQEPMTRLGRWNRLSCNTQIERRVQLANEDHCGTCEIEEVIKKTNSKIKNTRKNIIKKIKNID